MAKVAAGAPPFCCDEVLVQDENGQCDRRWNEPRTHTTATAHAMGGNHSNKATRARKKVEESGRTMALMQLIKTFGKFKKKTGVGSLQRSICGPYG